MPSPRKSSIFSTNRQSTSAQGLTYQKNYASQQSGTKRHQFQWASADFASITAGKYAPITLLKFVRNDGVTDDTPPSATASNNYQSNEVMNGSKVVNFRTKIDMKSLSSTKAFSIDVYEITCSFWEH